MSVTPADSVVDAYADGHLLLGWLSVWAVGIAALALFANTARKSATRLSNLFARRTQQRAQRHSDAHVLSQSRSDPRIMADILAAVGHAESMAQTLGEPPKLSIVAALSVRGWVARRLRGQADRALWATAQRDPRVMAEVQAAMERARASRQLMDQAMGQAWLARHPVGTFSAAYRGPRRAFRSTPLTGLPTHLQYLPA